jgi:hypothetical protein
MVKNEFTGEIYYSAEEYLAVDRKNELAKKLLSSRLSKPEKEEVYELLTGAPAPTSKGPGRPTHARDDQGAAFDFLFTVEKNNGPLSAKAKKALIAKYNIPPQSSGFYAAINRGVEQLHKRMSAKIPEYESAPFQFDERLLTTSKKLVSLIGDHRERNAKKGKRHDSI